MDQQEAYDRRHRKKMHEARRIISAKYRNQLLQLHRLPDRGAGRSGYGAGRNYARVQQALHRIVDRKIVVRKLAGQGGAQIANDIRRRVGLQLAAKSPGDDAVRIID